MRETPDGREACPARWGLPSPEFALRGKAIDRGLTNVRNLQSPHWRRWMNPENRCVVPFTSFSESRIERNGSRTPVWFALGEDRPTGYFVGLHVRRWTSVRKASEGAVTADLFGFLTTEPNAELARIHPKAMPVILRTRAEVDAWLRAPMAAAMSMQRPLPDGALRIVAEGERQDGSAPNRRAA